MNERTGPWIQTFSGVAFFPFDPRSEDIVIEDIAHALSMQCRFTGHTRSFYSVAEHCVHVSRITGPLDALWGLLHDASEAYMSNLSRPIKHAPEMEFYRRSESVLMGHIACRFGLSVAEPPAVKRADTAMLGIEARDLMSPLAYPEKWQWAIDAIGDCPIVLTRTWSPEEAEERFLDRFRELTGAKWDTPVRPFTSRDAASMLGRLSAERRRVPRVETDQDVLFEGVA